MLSPLIIADSPTIKLATPGRSNKCHKASLKDFKCVKDTLTRETGLPMSLEHHFKFVVLLMLEADQRMDALKHYFGLLMLAN
ncbi:MAG: hypothetical protein DLM72_12740 [Candidatus Nitrosopolaris wilkensis]|nr:MAG: hypothetical protein DLM72_12740 [Candidatus Nitrosopolaris wilkensis]